MELRSNHHLHYISAIKGSKVVKLLNVNQGKPTLSIKEISTILEQEPTTESMPLADRSLYEAFGFSKVRSIDQIYNDKYIGCSTDNISQDLDDTFLSELTLKQLKKKCKARKREIPRSVDKVVKQEYVESHPEEDSLDLEETLGSLKRKVSGKLKSRKMQKCESLPKTIAVKSEPVLFDQDFLQASGNIDMRASIKVEVSKPGYTVCREVACSSDDLHSSEHRMISTGKVIGETQVTDESCNKEVDSLIIVEEHRISDEYHTTVETPPTEIPVCEEMMDVDDLGIIEKVASELPDPDGCSPREESKSSLIAEHEVCVLKQIGYENKKHYGSSCLPPEIPVCEEMIKVDDPVIIEKVTSESPDPDGCLSSLIAEREVCVLSEISYEFIQHSGNSSLPPENSGYEEDLNVNVPVVAILAHEDEAITDVLTCNESPDILFPLWNVTAGNDTCIPSSHENKSPMHTVMSFEPDNQALNSDGGSCPMIPGLLDKSVNNQNIEAIPGNCGMPVMVKVESVDDSDNVSISVASESVECLQHPPARLLSSRKSISPDSQEKLCRAMKSIELPDYQETEYCKKRLRFEKQKVNGDANVNVGSDQVLTTSTVPEHTNTADISPNSEQKRGKEDRKRFRPNRGVNKAANLPSWHRLHSGCACMQGRSQHVVDFAQQQMNDIERLAARLAKDLRSMKEIVIETLLPEGRRIAKHNTNEVRIAVESASKVEDMARKLLGTMSRDCNRFCKIISLGEKDAASDGNKADKEEVENNVAACVKNSPGKEEAQNNDTSDMASRKKIKFADESGGSLCTVRLIEDQQSLLLNTLIENGEVRAD